MSPGLYSQQKIKLMDTRTVQEDEGQRNREIRFLKNSEPQIAVNREYPTEVLWCSTRLCDGSVLKPGQVEISQNYFVVVVFCVVHQVFQLNKRGKQIDSHTQTEVLLFKVIKVEVTEHVQCRKF